MSQQQDMAERYKADLVALAECVARGVSEESVRQLAFECGINRVDLEELLNYRQAA